jgi:hypothetical protein
MKNCEARQKHSAANRQAIFPQNPKRKKAGLILENKKGKTKWHLLMN